jgi:CBS domain-containing protein
MKIVNLMTQRVYTVTRETPYAKLWEAIVKRRINAVPVVDAKGRLVGIVTRDDLLTVLYPDQKEFVEAFSSGSSYEVLEEKVNEMKDLRAKNVMSKRVIFTLDTTPIMRALSRMIARRVSQLPVLDRNNRVVGVITKGDIFYALFKRQLKGKKEKAKAAPKRRASKAKAKKSKRRGR